MDKVLLVFKREYLSRVFKKSFLLTTLLTPFAILLFIVVVGLIFSYDSDEKKKVVVLDPGAMLAANLSGGGIDYEFSDSDLASLKAGFQESDYDGILYVPELDDIGVNKHKIFYYSDEQLSLDANNSMSRSVRNKIKDYKIVKMGIDPGQLQMLDTDVTLDPEPISEGKEDTSSMSTIVGSMLGGAMGYLMFFFIIIYGMMVMRSVMEEKINRIVEIIISSVKPFQLMLGKILGVGAVGLTQILIWLILIPLFSFIAYSFLGMSATDIAASSGAEMNIPEGMEESFAMEIREILGELGRLNWWLIVPLFIIYFIGGYIIYTSLFAAVGSAIGDDLNEGNSLTMPLMMPIILAVYMMIRVVAVPNSTLAVWSSMIPFLSPIIMPARLGADIPLWQIGVSVLLLVLFCIFSVWIAGRIYRVGILLYGKKASLKELGKWIFSK